MGYGNSLRQDDGVGWHAAALLARDERLAGCDVRQAFQLLPELALDVAHASRVVLVDAREAYDAPPGSLRAGRVVPDRRAGGFTSHRLSPGELLGLAEALYGAAPPTVLVAVAARDFDDGVDTLTPAVAAALPRIADVVTRLVRAGTAGP